MDVEINEQAVSRLNQLRSAIPFCERYMSQGIWFLPDVLKPSIDDTHKDIPKENLPFKSDILKNIVFQMIVFNYYLPDSYYKYEQNWIDLRQKALLFVQEMLKILKIIYSKTRFNFESAFDDGQMILKLEQSLKYVPKLSLREIEKSGINISEQMRKTLEERLKDGNPNRWSIYFNRFFIQIIEYIWNRNRRTGELALHNFRDVIKYLPEMHAAFGDDELNALEDRDYKILEELMDIWILNPSQKSQRNIMRSHRKKQEQRQKENIKRIQNAFVPLEKNGMVIVYPDDVYVSHPLYYLPLAFSVKNSAYPERELGVILEAISEVKDIADFFCLVPIHEGVRFLEGGYQISSNQIAQLNEGQTINWEAFALQELSQDILRCLPTLPFHPSVRLQIRANITSLLIGMIAFIEQKDKIETLRTSENQFEVKLYDLHKSRLLEIQADFGIAASKTIDSLKAEYSSLQDDTDFKTLIGFLEIIKEASQKDSVDALFVSSDFNAGDILNATERLLQK